MDPDELGAKLSALQAQVASLHQTVADVRAGGALGSVSSHNATPALTDKRSEPHVMQNSESESLAERGLQRPDSETKGSSPTSAAASPLRSHVVKLVFASWTIGLDVNIQPESP